MAKRVGVVFLENPQVLIGDSVSLYEMQGSQGTQTGMATEGLTLGCRTEWRVGEGERIWARNQLLDGWEDSRTRVLMRG